jgi:hypothetical protein
VLRLCDSDRWRKKEKGKSKKAKRELQGVGRRYLSLLPFTFLLLTSSSHPSTAQRCTTRERIAE